MSRLKARIVDLIEALGPISVAEYMALCLSDPQDGYYTTRDPFGRSGDFTTAPEVSQMFGELVGASLAVIWRAIGRPENVIVAEIGPGRGTLMKDMARALSQIQPDLRRSGSFKLIETSPKLAWAQATILQGTPGTFDWHTDIDELPRQPLLIVGNELFDAIPIRQYVKTAAGWRERMVDIDAGENFRFVAGAGSLDETLLPNDAISTPEGAIVEIAPARSALMQKIAARIATDRGAGIFIDYGYRRPAVGDTFQAMKNHAYVDPFAEPGEADLTAHVDFQALAVAARAEGLDAHLMSQGKFLLDMGILERAGQLGANADEAVRERLSSEVERLAAPDHMGTLFKVLAILPAGTNVPPFSAPVPSVSP